MRSIIKLTQYTSFGIIVKTQRPYEVMRNLFYSKVRICVQFNILDISDMFLGRLLVKYCFLFLRYI